MTDKLNQVLTTLDETSEAALARLFELLRIESVSNRPRLQGELPDGRQLVRQTNCATSALTLASSPRPAHEATVVADDRPKGCRWHAACPLLWALRCAAGRPGGHCGIRRLFDPLHRHRSPQRPGDRGPGGAEEQGELMTFLAAVRAVKTVAGELPLAVSAPIEGEEECRRGSEELLPGFSSSTVRSSNPTSCWCARHWPMGQGHARHHHHVARSRLARGCHHWALARPALGHLRRPGTNPIRAEGAGWRRHDGSGRVTLPGFYDGVAVPAPAQIEQWRKLGFEPEPFLASGRSFDALAKLATLCSAAASVAADARVQRHHRRLPGHRHQDRDPVQSFRQDYLPHGRRPGPREDRRAPRGVRARAASTRLQRRVHKPPAKHRHRL